MPKIQITPETELRLRKIAEERGCTLAELVEAMLRGPVGTAPTGPLVTYVASGEFRAKFSDAERYLALLAWVAKSYRTEFDDFLAHQASGRKYLGFSAEEIRETCHHNQARQIPDTHFWAIMNLDTPTKRRFLRRLLVFVGQPDDVIEYALTSFGGRA